MRRSWGDDDAVLIQLWNESEDSVPTIADKLGRSVHGIYYRAATLRREGVFLRERKQAYLSGEIRARPAGPPKLDPRLCNLCPKTFEPSSTHERFCPTCRSGGRIESVGRLDANWAVY